MSILLDGQNIPESIYTTVMCSILDIVFFIKFWLFKTGRTAEKKRKKNEEKRRKNEAKELAPRSIRAKHQAGLPLAIDEDCVIINEENCFVIQGGGNTFELKKDKVTAISVAPQFINQVTYNDLGRSSNINRMGMTFTYQINNEIKYMSFWMWYGNSNNINKANRWSVEIRNRNVNHNRIEI